MLRKSCTDYHQTLEKPFLSSPKQNLYTLQQRSKLVEYFPDMKTLSLDSFWWENYRLVFPHSMAAPSFLSNADDFSNINIQLVRCKLEIYHGKIKSQMTASELCFWGFFKLCNLIRTHIYVGSVVCIQKYPIQEQACSLFQLDIAENQSISWQSKLYNIFLKHPACDTQKQNQTVRQALILIQMNTVLNALCRKSKLKICKSPVLYAYPLTCLHALVF